MDATEREVREAEEHLRSAMLANDVDALRRLLHDEVRFSGPDGTIATKEDDLSAHAARRLRLTSLGIGDMQIRMDGSDVVVTVRAILAGTFDGAVCDGTYRYDRRWRKTGDQWQIIAGGVKALQP
jgi:ketosteroid isomerase-like protein